MAVIGQYRKKIKSAKNIAKLTRAMQFVAASKMKKAQAAALAGKEYAVGLTELTNLLSTQISEEYHPLLSRRNSNLNSLVLLIAPQKGLCGSLITNLTRFVAGEIAGTDKNNSEFVVVGSKAKLIAKRLGLSVLAEFDMELSYPKYESVPPIARMIREKFEDGSVGNVTAVFAEFVNTMQQLPKKRILLPLEMVAENLDLNNGEKIVEDKREYVFEPSVESIVNPLLEMYLETEIYQILLEAYASEQSARMVAMKNATDNATGLIDDLTIEFNKLRQAGITNEILDIGNASMIVSAYEN